MDPIPHKRKKFCNKCKKEFSAKYFPKHLKTHLATREKFKCSVDQCLKSYYSRSNLKLHLTNVHHSIARIRFKCDTCSKEYLSKVMLRLHIGRVHSGSGTRYGCSLCHKEFTAKRGRDVHVVMLHTGEKAFSCEECPSKFPTSSGLCNHRKSHTEARPHSCTICSNKYKYRNHLMRHMTRAHSNSRSRDFPCPSCQKTFYEKYTLNRHTKTHTEGSEFLCYFCKKRFPERAELYKHLRAHTQEKPFFCRDKSCQYSCSQSSNLQVHKNRHHQSEQSTPSKSCPCYFCLKIYSNFSDLSIHMRSHTLEEPYLCGLCKKSFKSGTNLRYHVAIHTNEKPFGCPHCAKSFIQSGALKRHIATHHN